jgi:hypothetical protein
VSDKINHRDKEVMAKWRDNAWLSAPWTGDDGPYIQVRKEIESVLSKNPANLAYVKGLEKKPRLTQTIRLPSINGDMDTTLVKNIRAFMMLTMSLTLTPRIPIKCTWRLPSLWQNLRIHSVTIA